MRVLVVEDDRKIQSFIVKGLRQSGFAVDHADDGEDGLDLALSGCHDVAVIDLMLPRLGGLALIERLRRHDRRLPVIILSAKRSVDDRVRGLQRGGDDYLTKPFAFSDLLARIHAQLRRLTAAPDSTRLVVGDLTLDLITREVTRGDRRLELRPREFSLLHYLMRQAGRPIPKTMILQHVWDYGFDPQTNVVEVLVSRLRDAVDGEASAKLIHTIRGVGYVLRVP